MKRILTIIFLLTCFFNARAQVKIEGVVMDCESEEPLIGANIQIGNTNQGTVADLDGKFALRIRSFPVLLKMSYVGYEKLDIQIDSIGSYEICLKQDHTLIFMIPHPRIPTIVDSPINIHMPAPFMKMTTQQLQRDNDLAITPALNRVSGVYMHSGALNTNRITIRGIGNRSPFSTTKIRAYLDDIPLTSGDGETTIEDIDLSLINMVNVWKGPTASIYGAGLGGMIHLQTNPYYSPSSLSTKTTMGSYGLIRNASAINFTNDKRNFNIKLNYNLTQSDGYRDNNEYDRQGFTALGKVKENNKNETTFIINHTNLKAFIPSSLNRDDYENAPTKAAFSWANVKGFEDGEKTMLGISHKITLAEIGKYDLKNNTSVFARTRDAYESRPFNILEEESRVMGLRTRFELNPKRRNSIPFPMLSLGIETFNENYNWQTYETNDGAQGKNLSDNKEQRKYYNLFAQYYKNISDNFSLLAGLNFNSTHYDYEDRFDADSLDLSGKYRFDPVLSPQLGLTYQIDYNLAFFVTSSHGFSPPALSETLTPDGAINPEIQPEQGWNFEIGSRGKLWHQFTYELSLYHMTVRDLLVAKRVGPDQFVGVNAGKTRHRGLEFYADFDLPINKGSFKLFSTYTYSNYKFIDFQDGDDDHSGNELTGTAPHNFSIGLDAKSNICFYGNVNFQYVDAFPMRDDNSIYSDAYQVMDLKIGYAKTFFSNFDLDLSFGIRNVLDEKYASMVLINAGSFGGNAPRYYYPGLPRNYYVGLDLKYWL